MLLPSFAKLLAIFDPQSHQQPLLSTILSHQQLYLFPVEPSRTSRKRCSHDKLRDARSRLPRSAPLYVPTRATLAQHRTPPTPIHWHQGSFQLSLWELGIDDGEPLSTAEVVLGWNARRWRASPDGLCREFFFRSSPPTIEQQQTGAAID